jgi:hypothetical protein
MPVPQSGRSHHLPRVLAETGVEALVLDTIHMYLEVVPMSRGIPYAHVWAILNIDFSGTTLPSVVAGRYENTPEERARNIEDLKKKRQCVALFRQTSLSSTKRLRSSYSSAPLSASPTPGSTLRSSRSRTVCPWWPSLLDMTSLAWLLALPTTESANLLGRRPLSRRLARAHSKSSEYSLLWREGAVLQEHHRAASRTRRRRRSHRACLRSSARALCPGASTVA